MSEFDYIVVGGGSAGCCIAARLTEDPNVSVALIEAGGTYKSKVLTVPFFAVFTMPAKFKNWAYETVPQKGLNGRKGYQPRGKALGGSSAINAMIYIRGVKSDYDEWAKLGNTGWAYKDVLPYFKKAEHHEAGADKFHGQGGPLNVAPITSPSPANDRFIAAAQAQQLPHNSDFNGAKQEGVGLYEVTQKGGERCSSARAYLSDAEDRPNLTIFTKALTEKIELDGDRASGVQIKQGGKRQTLKAKREVILCAGAFGSPQIMLLSGIGPKDKLEPHGIAQTHDLPGVGENLQDHIDWIANYTSKSDEVVSLGPKGIGQLLREWKQYKKDRTGTMSTNFAESGGFAYSDRREPSPDLQFHFVRSLVDDHARKLHLKGGYSLHVCVLRPKSRGSLWLNSVNPKKAPAIDPNFLGEEEDLETLYRGARMAQSILQDKAFEPIKGEPLYGAEAQSREELIEDIRNRADTVYHPVGTCKMGVDDMAVVDPQLRVHGLKGLRVADASIMPNLISGNTNAPSIMIGEKAADMIKADAHLYA